jgi:putative cell wall-binding protein
MAGSVDGMRGASLRVAAVAIALCTILAGCGKSLPQTSAGGAGAASALSAQGAASVSTANTTRLGGASPVEDAAAVAVAAHPGLTPATRPPAVVVVSESDWPAALAASVLAGAPLHAPLLYSEGTTLPAISAEALRRIDPTGLPALGVPPGGRSIGPAPVVRVGDTATPPGYPTRVVKAGSPAALAVAVERLASELRGHAPRQVIVVAADGPPAFAMGAAGLAAESGSPILYVDHLRIPRATSAELARLGRPSIYVVGPSAVVSEGVERQLEAFGHVTRIAGATPQSNAIALARFTNGSFGWGVVEPGHGFVFASAARPLDGPAAAPLAAGGDYAPLLLVEGPDRIGSALGGYLGDLQPGSPPSGPVHGVYNHGWLIGDESAISATTQARLDAVLGISSRPAAEAEVATPTTTSSETTPASEP